MNPGMPAARQQVQPREPRPCGWPRRRRTFPPARRSARAPSGSREAVLRRACAGRRQRGARARRRPPIRCASLQMRRALSLRRPRGEDDEGRGLARLQREVDVRVEHAVRLRLLGLVPVRCPSGRGLCGITPRTGIFRRSSMSATSRRLVSKYSSASATPIPSTSPKTSALAMLSSQLGRLGPARRLRRVQDLDRALRDLEVDLALAQRKPERRVQARSRRPAAGRPPRTGRMRSRAERIWSTLAFASWFSSSSTRASASL